MTDNWNNLTASERFSAWRTFRESIKDLSVQEQLIKINSFFGMFPVSARSIDFYSPETWPSPWDILHSNTWCESSLTLMMYYTLSFVSSSEVNNLAVWLIDDTADCHTVLVHGNKQVLNYYPMSLATVEDLESNTTVLAKYSSSEIKQLA